MLKALESGKHRGLVLAGISDPSERRRWLEDLVSAAVLGRIQYLPDEAIARLFSGVLGVPGDFGSLVEFAFWPSYRRMDDTGDVEPDAVIEFESAIVLIEAKRHDGIDMHSDAQLSAQFEAVQREFEEGETPGRPLYAIALGGHRGTHDSTAITGKWRRLSWTQLHRAIEVLEIEGEHCERIKSDISKAFLYHGIKLRDPLYFGTLEPVGISAQIERLPLSPAPLVKFRPFPSCGLNFSSFPGAPLK